MGFRVQQLRIELISKVVFAVLIRPENPMTIRNHSLNHIGRFNNFEINDDLSILVKITILGVRTVILGFGILFWSSGYCFFVRASIIKGSNYCLRILTFSLGFGLLGFGLLFYLRISDYCFGVRTII